MSYLFVQRGGGEGSRRAFDQPRLRVGRSADNDICLKEDLTVSRVHAEFTREGERHFVKDAGSRSGIRVNGERVEGLIELRQGDRITLGKTVIHFLLEGDREPAPQELPSGPVGGARPGSISAARPGSVPAARPGPVPAARPGSISAERPGSVVLTEASGALSLEKSVSVHLSEIVTSDFSTGSTRAANPLEVASRSRAFEILTQAAETFLGQNSLDDVLAVSMDMVHRAAAPDRAAIMLLEGTPPSLRVRSQRGADGKGAGDTIQISRTIAQSVLGGRQAVLTSDAMGDPRFAAAQSVILQRVHSAMCVPLWNNKEVIGLIYVDTLRLDSSYSREDLQVLTLVANMAAIKIENVRLFLREQQMKELEREMAAAAKIQQRLLPSTAPRFAGYDLAGRNIPCLAVGGDYFDLQLRDQGRLGVVIGDVSGKGLGAALLMATAQGAFRAHFLGASSVPDLVSRLNHVVMSNASEEQFLTLFCCEIDGAAGQIRYVNAGHNPPLLIRSNGEVERLVSGGMALGILPGVSFAQQETRLDPGDFLTLYSDGITESQDDVFAEFGEERLVSLLREMREERIERILERVFEAAKAFAGQAPQFDDMTLVLIRRQSGSP